MGKKARNPPPPNPTAEETDATGDISATIPSFYSFPSPSSDFEFTVSLSPTSKKATSSFCPADELFYMGQILPLHLTPRISMVRTLLLASSSGSSSSDTAATDSRDSSGSSSSDSTASFNADLLLLAAAVTDCDSSRPSSVTEDDAKKVPPQQNIGGGNQRVKYLSSLASRFSSVFHRNKKEPRVQEHTAADAGVTITSNSTSAKDVIRKYVRKVRPLYEKLSNLQHNNQSRKDDHQQQQNLQQKKTFSFTMRRGGDKPSRANPAPNSVRSSTSSRKANLISNDRDHHHGRMREVCSHAHSLSFSGNLRYPRKKKCAMAASCPSSMRSSPSHSGLLCPVSVGGGGGGSLPVAAVQRHSPSATSMEELQSAIQGAIAHCKNSMVPPAQKKAPAVSSQQ